MFKKKILPKTRSIFFFLKNSVLRVTREKKYTHARAFIKQNKIVIKIQNDVSDKKSKRYFDFYIKHT